MSEHEKYVSELVERLRQWLENHVVVTDFCYEIAGNTFYCRAEAVEAILRRFPPPPFPPAWDDWILDVIRRAIDLLLPGI